MLITNLKDYPVLFVDDEKDSRTVFKKSFEDKFNIFIASSASEGLKLLDANPNIAVTVSDQRMPDTPGTTFLEKIQNDYPDVVRILVTAFSSYEIALEAINVGRVYSYSEKPWDPEKMYSELYKAVEYYCLNQLLKREIAEKTKALEELKKTQSMLVQTEKLSTIGELTASFAHEIRNPVSIISGNAEFQLKKLLGDINKEAIEKALKEIVAQSERVSQIIEKIRVFAKPSKAELQVINLVEVVDDSLSLVNQELKSYYVEVEKDLTDVDFVLGDKIQLEQVFVNLIRNSIQAMGHKGRLKIIGRTEDKNKMVHIYIKDYGPGIPKENMDKLFEIFFTTKERGTGVGLFISNQIVNSMGGKLAIESEPGEGTTSIVSLPRINK